MRIQMHLSILVFKSINDLAPNNVSELFIQNNKFHRYYKRKKNDLHLPKIKRELGK